MTEPPGHLYPQGDEYPWTRFFRVEVDPDLEPDSWMLVDADGMPLGMGSLDVHE